MPPATPGIQMAVALLDLKAQQVREEIALVMPHLLEDKRAGARKKTPRPGMQDGSARSRRS